MDLNRVILIVVSVRFFNIGKEFFCYWDYEVFNYRLL